MDTLNLDIWEIVLNFLKFSDIRRFRRVSKQYYEITSLCVTRLDFSYSDIFNQNHQRGGENMIKYPPWNLLIYYPRLRSCNSFISTTLDSFDNCLDVVASKLSECTILCTFDTFQEDRLQFNNFIDKFCQIIMFYPQKSFIIYFYDPLLQGRHTYELPHYSMSFKYDKCTELRDTKCTLDTLFLYYDTVLTFYVKLKLSDCISITWPSYEFSDPGVLIDFSDRHVRFKLSHEERRITYPELE